MATKLTEAMHRLICRHPMRYTLFGAWWWSVKWTLSEAGYYLGSNDDPDLRERMSKRAKHDPERILQAGLREYRRNLGGYHDGNITVDGDPYFLHDDLDVTLYAVGPTTDGA